MDLKAVCEENSCEGARREDVPEDGQCIAMVTGAEQCRPAEGGGCEAPVGSTYLVVACMNKSTRIVANNQVYNTNNVNDNVQGKYSLTYIRMWPHYHKWYWVTDDAPDNLTYKEFIQNVSKWGIPSTAGGDYHGPACSIPVLYTLKDEKLGEIIKMEIGQNDVEAAYFMVDRYWLLDKTDTNYDKTFRYALAWFVKDPNNQAGHLMSLPSKPEWLP